MDAEHKDTLNQLIHSAKGVGYADGLAFCVDLIIRQRSNVKSADDLAGVLLAELSTEVTRTKTNA